METDSSAVVGLLLAGGRSSRMGGGDKCLQPLGRGTLLAHVIDRSRPQVARLLLNAAGDPGRFAAYGLPVLADAVEGHAGPLAGILAGLEWAAAQPAAPPWLATFPTDAPFFPRHLVARLAASAGDAEIACARSAGRLQPLFAIWRPRLAADLRRAITLDAARRVDRWLAGRRLQIVDFPAGPVDPFFNINRPEDLTAAGRLLAALDDAPAGAGL